MQLTKIKTVREFLWPLLEINLSIPGLIWQGTACFVQNDTTITLPGDAPRTTSELLSAERRRPIFGAEIEA